MKWNEIYKNEEELIAEMMTTKSDVKSVPYGKLVHGYEFIEGFKKYYKEHGMLTEAQMRQLKRLAGEIYKNNHWDCFK